MINDLIYYDFNNRHMPKPQFEVIDPRAYNIDIIRNIFERMQRLFNRYKKVLLYRFKVCVPSAMDGDDNRLFKQLLQSYIDNVYKNFHTDHVWRMKRGPRFSQCGYHCLFMHQTGLKGLFSKYALLQEMWSDILELPVLDRSLVRLVPWSGKYKFYFHLERGDRHNIANAFTGACQLARINADECPLEFGTDYDCSEIK